MLPLAFDVVEIAGMLDGIDMAASQTTHHVPALRETARGMGQAMKALVEGFEALGTTAADAGESARGRLTIIGTNAERFRKLSDWGLGIEPRTQELDAVQRRIVAGNAEIARISRQVNILAVNASIEAARAGEAGRGFAVVAEAVGALSRKTAAAVADIGAAIASLEGWTDAMRGDAQRMAPVFAEGTAAVEENLRGVEAIAGDMAEARKRIEAMRERVADMHAAGAAVAPAVEAIAEAAVETAVGIGAVRKRSERLMDGCETLLQDVSAREGSGRVARFVAHVEGVRDRVAALLEAALADERITEAELFSTRYIPIPGSDPVQHMAPFTELCDEVLAPLIASALELDPAVVFCVPADRNGYVPTHNVRFSHPQGDDPAWNAANSRNRRIFDDRVGAKAGANRRPFLLQVYRRDLGAEGMVMMKDVSVPLMLRGRHWGCIRMGYAQREEVHDAGDASKPGGDAASTPTPASGARAA